MWSVYKINLKMFEENGGGILILQDGNAKLPENWYETIAEEIEKEYGHNAINFVEYVIVRTNGQEVILADILWECNSERGYEFEIEPNDKDILDPRNRTVDLEEMPLLEVTKIIQIGCDLFHIYCVDMKNNTHYLLTVQTAHRYVNSENVTWKDILHDEWKNVDVEELEDA